MRPHLSRSCRDGICVWSDEVLLGNHGLLIAFVERTGGVSSGPYRSLNLASHVGDDPADVRENRRRAARALGLGDLLGRLTTAEQVHGAEVAVVTEHDADPGGLVESQGGPSPVAGADALVTVAERVPLALFFADCVPVAIAAPFGARRAVALVHAGWRGALGRLPGKAARAVAREASCRTSDLLAYIGPHICAAHYEVGWEVLSQFESAFDTIAAAPEARGRRGPLDLGAAVSESLSEVGVPPHNILHAGLCTYESEDAFFSYRRAAITGRHGAVACVLEEGR